jgi:hypothetical protein
MRVAQHHEPRRLRSAVFEKERAARDRDLGALEDARQRRERVAQWISVVVEKKRERRFG